MVEETANANNSNKPKVKKKLFVYVYLHNLTRFCKGKNKQTEIGLSVECDGRAKMVETALFRFVSIVCGEVFAARHKRSCPH